MLKAGDFHPKPKRKPTKLSKSLQKRLLTFVEDHENLKCQKYGKGKCADFAVDKDALTEFCSVCQIQVGLRIIKAGAEKYNPKQIKF